VDTTRDQEIEEAGTARHTQEEAILAHAEHLRSAVARAPIVDQDRRRYLSHPGASICHLPPPLTWRAGFASRVACLPDTAAQLFHDTG
jgi:hypothetical protein